MIYGIGQDVVEIERMDSAWQRFGERFAAKEAFAKALGTGLRPPATLSNIAISHDAFGRPSLTLAAPLQVFLSERGVTSHHLSISDERSMAVSVCVLQKAP
ncbi:MAG: 4'-phosphopantetheinyl transferase superfamily protein [Betaproteobacteria bacterium]|nr:4'-phosphopantetheinyl transferase superfamily protein [Betaproteobacteria bacterium]